MEIRNANPKFQPIELVLTLSEPLDVAWLIQLFGAVSASALYPRDDCVDALRYLKKHGHTPEELVAHISSLDYKVYNDLRTAINLPTHNGT